MFWVWNKPKKEQPKPVVDEAERSFQGNDIWRIIEAGLYNYGMVMRRDGSAQISTNKFGKGGWILRVKVDPKPAAVLDLVTDDGEIINTSDWNKLTQEERIKFVQERGARFKVKDKPEDGQQDAEI